MPFAFFCTTTNVQDEKFVSLKNYVNVRKIIAKKPLRRLEIKTIILVFGDKTAYIGMCLQARVPVARTVSMTFKKAFRTRLILNFSITFMGL